MKRMYLRTFLASLMVSTLLLYRDTNCKPYTCSLSCFLNQGGCICQISIASHWAENANLKYP